MTDRYSFSLTTFSPSGNLVQIEYALNAVSQGVTGVGIKGLCLFSRLARAAPDLACIVKLLSVLGLKKHKDSVAVYPRFYLIYRKLLILLILAVNGVVIAGEKTTSVLIQNESIEKVSKMCENIGMVYSGMGPDARVLLLNARKSALRYAVKYNEDPPVSVVVKDIAEVVQEYTQSGYIR